MILDINLCWFHLATNGGKMWDKVDWPLPHSLLPSQIYPQWRLNPLRSLSFRQDGSDNFAYGLSLCKSVCERYTWWLYLNIQIWNINFLETVSTIAKIRHKTLTEVGIRHRMAPLCNKHFLVISKATITWWCTSSDNRHHDTFAVTRIWFYRNHNT